MPRLFTALEISRDAALSLSLLRGGLIGPKGSVRWIDPENYHITLRFIGDVEGHVADEIVHALDRIDRQSFTLQLAGVDVFGSKKPHSIYAGVAPSPDLLALQAEMERICQRLRLPPDPRKFTPHVTLARLKGLPDMQLARYLSERGNFTTLPFNVSRFVLMSSKESTGGGPYVTEEVWPLRSASFNAGFENGQDIPASNYHFPAGAAE
ncbi:RNA 2',3'-cyclic phosphodiesterase [Pseudochrobactrum asaccharolyticum]|uniref:RNA 2',3'-cyclic phosphodiesterase n=1 Tax=Pseudochrobactrum asaccharolyticum TaxID=354351 RepID=A0A366E5H3_9HYPH|nr:RNA 2',3'-cyclic phosphodiesterase [Pseudochrobactrum asaccharolyticum]MCF7644424.1 RNA 2',3'-cyclic phosphodiesterase [Pseudochrobactrum asaccharolyticum]MCF7670337.1 RNA 2',3'-cyclic phosphodiesterase [Bacillus subtilis]RBO97636.1 2'-5' RNA ligase [Pseudochrobactrum asaccharolyticum]